MQPLVIPYKRQAVCGLDELAAELAAKARRQQSGGVAFAQKEDREEKNAARRQILSLLTLEKEPDKISILTMPGLNWTFEVQLLHQRDPNWKKERATKKTQFTCVENDRPVYYSATMSMPGRRHGCVRYLERPQFAERAIGHQIIGRYAFANVDDLMQDPTEVFDVAWLDYTGPLTIERMKIIEQFWQRRVRSLLVVTALKARWNQATGKVIARHGSCLDWMSTRLPGHVHHAIEYQNGASSMVQLAVAKVGR